MNMRLPNSRRNRLRVGVSIVAAASLALLAVGCATPAEPEETGSSEPVTIRVATAVDQYVGYIAVQAMEQLGTFEGANINVEVIAATTPTLGQVMAAGQADVSMGSPGTQAAARAQGVEQSIVAAIVNDWDYVVVVSNAGNFPNASSLEDLKGANFGITGQGSPGNYLLHQWADELGWGDGDFSESALGNIQALFAALDSGQVDALLWAADQGIAAEARGTGTYFDLGMVEPNVLQTFSVMDDFAAEHADALKIFFEHHFAMVEKMQADPQLYIDVLVDDWKRDAALADALAERSLPLMSTDGSISPAELEGVQNSIPFLTGDPGGTPPEISFNYWKDLK